jgi:hypothetical protein
MNGICHSAIRHMSLAHANVIGMPGAYGVWLYGICP